MKISSALFSYYSAVDQNNSTLAVSNMGLISSLPTKQGMMGMYHL